MSLYNANGHVRITVVDGTTVTGMWAADGSINVFNATDETGFVGLYHPCGAINIVVVDGSALVGRFASNGATNVVNNSANLGTNHPSGALNVSGDLAASGANELLAGDNGLALDFTDDFWFTDTGFYGSAAIVGGGTSDGYNTSPDTAAASLLTYTSPSVKMTMGPSGTLRFGAHNLCLQSETLATSPWTAVLGGTCVANVVTDDSAATFEGWRQNITTIAGATYACTLWVLKDSNTSRFPELQLDDGTAASHYITLNTQTGALGARSGAAAGGSASVTSDGLYWKVTITITTTSTTTAINIYPAITDALSGGSIVNSLTGSVQIDKVHFRRTPSDSTYLATTTAARYALPYEWNTSGVLQGIRVEEARTNTALRSEELDNAQWVKNQVSVTANAIAAPNGTTTFDLVTEDGTTNNHGIFSGNLGLSTSGTACTASVYARRNGRDIQITFNSTGFGASQFANFDLATGALGTVTGGTARIEDVGSGTYRCSFTATATAIDAGGRGFSVFLINSTSATRAPSYAGNSTSGAYVWGTQDEIGSFPTSYIPTTASTVTRAADNITLATSAFPLSATEGTIYGEFISVNASSGSVSRNIVTMSDGTLNECVTLRGLGNNPEFFIADSGNFDTLDAGVWVSTGTGKLTGAWAANDGAACYNGGTVVTDSDVGTPTPTALRVGMSFNSTEQYNGVIQKLMYLPRRMTNAELQTLTT